MPVHQVFLNHSDLNPWLVKWAEAVPIPRRNRLLTLLPRVAFEKLPCLRTAQQAAEVDVTPWASVPSEPPQAELVTSCSHTKHPYVSATHTLEVHRIKGAAALELSFDRRSSTEEEHDFVKIFAGPKFEELVYVHSGPSASCWPGTAGVPPVVVAGEEFGVSFESDIEGTSWGWQITARARVPEALVVELREEMAAMAAAGVVAAEVSNYALELALAGAQLDVEKAKLKLLEPNFIQEHQEPLPSPGYYRSAARALAGDKDADGGGVRVNLQSAEVYLATTEGATRMYMPAPPAVAQHPDFVQVFRGEQKYVVEVARRTRCQEFELSHDGTVYRVAVWKPLSPSAAGGNAIVSYAQRPIGVHTVAKRMMNEQHDKGKLKGLTLAQFEDCVQRAEFDETEALKLLRNEALDGEGQRSAKKRVMHVPGQQPEAVETKVEAWGLPQQVGSSKLQYQAELYLAYTVGSLGWVSRLLDASMPAALEALGGGGVKHPRLYASEETIEMGATGVLWVEQAEPHKAAAGGGPARLLMYLPPQGGQEKLRRGNPGNWYEIVALFDRQLLEVYSLTALGRRLQRKMVFASDQRFSLSALEQSTRPREQPWVHGTRHCAGDMFEGVMSNGKPLIPGGAPSWEEAIGSVVIHRWVAGSSMTLRPHALS